MKKIAILAVLICICTCSISAASLNTKELYKDGLNALRAYFKTGLTAKFDSAVAKFKLLMRKEPDNKTAEMMLGILYTVKGQKIADKLMKQKHPRKSVYFQIGNLFLMQNRFKEAIECYDICNKAYPKWKCPFRHRGEAELKAGMADKAVDTLYHCISLDEKHFDAWVFLGEALIEAKRYNEAEKALNSALKHALEACDPNHEEEATLTDCYKLFVKLYEKTGNYTKLNFYKNKLSK